MPLVRAQQRAMPSVGFMSSRSPEDSAYLVAAFRDGLAQGGLIEGRTVAIEFRWARGEYARLPSLAAELINQRVAVLVAVGGDPSARAAKEATRTLPIVFGMGGDPVAAGLVASFNRPGGNATGFTLLTVDMEPKRLGLLHEIVPGVALVGVLVNKRFAPAAHQVAELEEAARTTGQHLFVAEASNDADLHAAFAMLLERRIGALLVTADPYFDTRRERIIAFAAQNRLPAIYQFREYAVDGGLMSYGPSIIEAYRQAGAYAARIVKGTKPGELPVLQPTKYEFIINVKTAKALDFRFPSGVSARADEIIQ